MAFWLALKYAGAKVSYQVKEAMDLIAKTSATSQEWDKLVVPPCIRLVEKTLPFLSRGFGTGH